MKLQQLKTYGNSTVYKIRKLVSSSGQVKKISILATHS